MTSCFHAPNRSAAFLFVMLLLLAGCGAGPPSGTDDDPTAGVLKGRVVDSADPETGLAGVTVRVEGTDLVAVTDANGNFEFSSVESGDRAVVIDIPEGLDYQESRVEVSIHDGETVDMDVAVLPGGFHPDRLDIEPRRARVGILESVHYYVSLGFDGPEWTDESEIGADGGATGPGPDGDYPVPFRPTWTIRSEKPIGVISREGIFIGTAPGRGEIVATFNNDNVAIARIEVVSDNEVARIFVVPHRPFTMESGRDFYFVASAITGAGSFLSANEIEWSLVPSVLGSIERADDLTAGEREEILFGLRPTDDGPPMHGGGMVPEGGAPLLEKYSIARFHATGGPPDDGIRGEIRASVGDYGETVPVEVIPRGELLRVEIVPGDAEIETGGAALFVAAGFNRFDRPMGNLEYAWELVPPDLGMLVGDWPDWPDWPDNPGMEDGGEGETPPPPMGDETGRPLPGGPMARLFLPDRPGEGTVRVSVTDPGAGITIEAAAQVVVFPSE